MCLSAVYKAEQKPENLVLNNVQRIEDRDGTLILTNIMDQQVAVEGRIIMADLVGSVVVIEETKQ
ncbi:MAG: CooT family nickel-binding protein [Oscillospiraceae bacterium]|nr:CooT family nickel-binding protein [Oscillospiraceae bacterium]